MSVRFSSILVAIAVVVAGLSAQGTVTADPGGATAPPVVKKQRAVTLKPETPRGKDAVSADGAKGASAAKTVARRKVVWPAAASSALGAGKAPKVRLGAVSVSASQTSAKLPVSVVSQTTSRKAGVHGVMVEVDAAGAKPQKLKVALDTSTFAHAYGADWESRLGAFAYPDCVLTRPKDPLCAKAVPLETSHEGTMVSATVPARLASKDLVVALQGTSGSADGHGDFSATPMTASAAWSAGGSSGAFTWSYPMRVPPANNGPAPNLAINYNSQIVDGRTASTNNQSSDVGEGFGFTESYVQRDYTTCSNDGISGKRDLCWKTDNATLVLNGAAQELAKAADGTWRLRDDDGSRIRRLSGGPGSNGDNDKEHWELTTADGTRYVFGQSQIPGRSGNTNSVWWVPVAGDDSGDACHGSTFAASFCNQGWRWNLDYVVDPHGNTMSYWYLYETNRYAKNGVTSSSAEYVRGGRLARIDYGTREATPTPVPMRVAMSNATRCLASSGCSAYTKVGWPDTPYDQICTTSNCGAKTAPTFFTRTRIVSITTQINTSSGYQDVDRWSVAHAFMKPGGSGSTYATVLWPTSITHTGLVGATINLPKVTFAPGAYANRVDSSTDGLSALQRYRLTSIETETGGQIGVNYVSNSCTGTKPIPSANTSRCFPVRWTPKGDFAARTDWFKKYTVSNVTENDTTANAPPVTTYYTYHGAAAWAYDDNPLIPASYRTWSDFRGYGSVTTTVGDPALTSVRSQSTVKFLRGMHGDRTGSGGTRSVTVSDSSGTSHTDSRPYAGFALETTLLNGAGGDVLSRTISTPWSTRTAGSGLKGAWLVGVERSEVIEATNTGGTRTRRVDTTFNDQGLATRISDHGDTAVNDDQSCAATEYADETTATGTWRVGFTKRVVESVGVCGANALTPSDSAVLGETQTFYDGHGLDTTPTRGLVTKQTRAATTSGGARTFQTVATTAYDAWGRPTSMTSPTGAGSSRTDTIAYTRSAQGTTTGTTSTTDAGGKNHTTTVTLDPAWALPTKLTDANGKSEHADYDALGRLVSHWAANRATSMTPSTTYVYNVRNTAPSTVLTRTLNTHGSGHVLRSVEHFDALLRPRQRQVPSLNGNGDKTVTSQVYDARGLLSAELGEVYAAGGPSSTLLNVGQGQSAANTRYTRDGAGRVTQAALYTYNTYRWKTTTAHLGMNKTKVTPPAGAPPQTTMTDVRGQVTTSIEHGTPNLTTTRSYDLRGNLTGLQAPAGTWSWDYDLRGRRTTAVDPDTGTTTTAYTDNDLPATSTDARGKSTHTTYDTLNRPSKLYEGTTPSASKLLTSWTYDSVAKGLPSATTRYIDGESGTAISTSVTDYTSWGEPIEQELTITPGPAGSTGADLVEGLPTTLEWRRSHNVDMSLDSLRLPKVAGASGTALSTEFLEYTYNNHALPTNVNGYDALVQDVTYDSYGRVTIAAMGQSTATKFWVLPTRDEGTGRLTRNMALANQSQDVVSDHRYTYDDAGNITRDADVAQGTNHDVTCHRYDDHQRLAATWTPSTGDCATNPSQAGLGGPAPQWQGWTFNDRGLRATQSTTTPTTQSSETYTYPAVSDPHPNSVTTITTTGTAAGTRNYAYDESGNTTTRPDTTPDGAAQDLDWNAEGKLSQLVTERDGASATTTYLYGADGELLLQSNDTETVLFAAETEIHTDNDTGDLSAQRHYALPGGVSGVRASDTQLDFLLTNPAGTGTIALDGATLTPERNYTSPYGEQRGTKPPAWPTTRGFLGKPEDTDTGLTSVGARQYDPTTGRFISVDPLMDPSSPSQLLGYAYANNNPNTFTDPTGLMNDFLQPGAGLGSMMQGSVAQPQPKASPSKSKGGAKPRGKVMSALSKAGGVFKKGGSAVKEGVKLQAKIMKKEYAGAVLAVSSVANVAVSCGQFGIPTGGDCQGALTGGGGYVDVDGILGMMGESSSDPFIIAVSLLVPIPGGVFASGTRGAPRLIQLMKGIGTLGRSRIASGAAKAGTEVAETCLNSFTGTTLVLMADGTKKPIKDVKVGDKVMATDPETGETGPRKVIDLIRHSGPHTMVAVRLSGGSMIDATDHHPFWVESRGEWVDAIDLQPGDVVITADGDRLTVTKRGITEQDLTAYNLTVQGVHAYFAGSDSVLVHNAGPCMSFNQMNSAIRRGQAPKGIERIDRGKVPGAEQPHAVFGRGQGAPSLNIDGTWKHGFVELTNKQRDWLIANGWNL
ncbi:RHS repeat-associated protein [Nocardioides daedukensis]|uniref:RHS repeat-associated protein n=1 Tax=Nocardioides daedukensis TaxID=634462 RepID=A0A7Y9UQM7_9ACTN|nr:polymorphic toxin-type HINT domain-containing protein [Nocardioides daedukensis]NYG58766.1 RHS repeat-associated protein [Nocardioides daedukensis]